VLSCACKNGANKEPRQTITTRRFMGEKAGKLNSVIENQDSDLNLESALWHTLTCRTLRTFKTGVAAISHHCQGIARPKICADGGDLRSTETGPRSGYLVQNSLQLVKVHRLTR